MQQAIPTVVMRDGTSKGLYFLREDLPANDVALQFSRGGVESAP